MVLKAVWDLNQCLRYSQNPKCYNNVNECSCRVTSMFRMATSDLCSVLQSNLAPTEIYMVRMLIGINRLAVISNE